MSYSRGWPQCRRGEVVERLKASASKADRRDERLESSNLSLSEVAMRPRRRCDARALSFVAGDFDHDFAEVRIGCHPFVRGTHLGEWKDTVDFGAQLAAREERQ